MSSVVSKERLLVLVFVTAEEFLWFSGFSSLSWFAPHTDSYFLSLVGSDLGKGGFAVPPVVRLWRKTDSFS